MQKQLVEVFVLFARLAAFLELLSLTGVYTQNPVNECNHP